MECRLALQQRLPCPPLPPADCGSNRITVLFCNSKLISCCCRGPIFSLYIGLNLAVCC